MNPSSKNNNSDNVNSKNANSKNINSLLCARMKERRTMLNLTLKQIAEALHITEATAQRYECGEIKNIPYEKIVMLAEILQCSPPYLLGWEYLKDLPPEVERILNFYNQLNEDGKKEAEKQLDNLTLIPKYTETDK